MGSRSRSRGFDPVNDPIALFRSPPLIPNSTPGTDPLRQRRLGNSDNPDGESDGMDETVFQNAFRQAMDDAVAYIDEYIGPQRAEALNLYNGLALGNEKDGLSKIVMREVHDAVEQIVPTLLRLFGGTGTPVEFIPANKDSVDQAKQISAYINQIFVQDNQGYTIIQNIVRDALIQKLGIVKWGWVNDHKVTHYHETGLYAAQVQILQDDPEVEIDRIKLIEELRVDSPEDQQVQDLLHLGSQDPASLIRSLGTGVNPHEQPQPQPQQGAQPQMTGLMAAGQQPQQDAQSQNQALPAPIQPISPSMPPQAPQEPTYEVWYRHIEKTGRPVIDCLPPEEYFINRDARDANRSDGYLLQGHRRIMTISDVLEMHSEFDLDDILPYAGTNTFSMNLEQQARNPVYNSGMSSYDSPDPSLRRVLFVEAYMKLDSDGDGIAELHRIHAIGDTYQILSSEMVDEAPFATYCAQPVAHMVFGGSVTDQVKDLQRIKSAIMRGIADSLAMAIHPRTVFAENDANADDIEDTAVGANIRVKKDINSVRELVKPFIGDAALQVVNYFDAVRAKRTGLTDASMGLSPDQLQSSTESAVQMTISGSQERIEMYARNLAETLMVRMFAGLARMIRENQDAPRTVELNGDWVALDPRAWVGDLQTRPAVLMGRGTDSQKMAGLLLIAQKQEMIIQQLGPFNPLCGIDRLRETYAQIIQLHGFKDADKFIAPVTPAAQQQLAQLLQQKQAHPQGPELLARAEVDQIHANITERQSKLQLEYQKAIWENERQRERNYLDAITKLYQTEAQYGREPNTAVLSALLDHEVSMAEIQSKHIQGMNSNVLNATADQNAALHGNALQARSQQQVGQTSAVAKALAQVHQNQLQAQPAPGPEDEQE